MMNKKIIKINETNMSAFDALAVNDQFIMDSCGFEYIAVKLSERFAAIVNIDGKFVLALKWKNCFSISFGTAAAITYVFDTMSDIKELVARNGDMLIEEEEA